MRKFISRPKADKKRINSKNEFELCYIRHRYFRKVKYNPTEEEMKPYQSIINRMAKTTYYTYRHLFIIVGFEIEDIVNIGLVHLVNFLGLFSIHKRHEKYSDFSAKHKEKYSKPPSKEDLLNKNKANLTMFIKQRMEDLIRICRQKAKNVRGIPVEECATFYGQNPPPENRYELLEDNEEYGFKKIDLSIFKKIKKKAKPKDDEIFNFAGYWYISVPLEHRNLTLEDLGGAGFSPYNNTHNMDPEEILVLKREKEEFEQKREIFNGQTHEEKAIIIKDFINKHKIDPKFKEEIKIATKALKQMEF